MHQTKRQFLEEVKAEAPSPDSHRHNLREALVFGKSWGYITYSAHFALAFYRHDCRSKKFVGQLFR
jgi:hypothetical protein